MSSAHDLAPLSRLRAGGPEKSGAILSLRIREVLTRAAVETRRMGARALRRILPDKAQRWVFAGQYLQGSRYGGRRPGSSDVRPLRGAREADLAEQVNPVHRHAAGQRQRRVGLEPVSRACEATRTSEIGSSRLRSSSRVQKGTCRGVSIRGARFSSFGASSPCDVQQTRRGAAESKGCTEACARSKRAKRIATPTSRVPDSANCSGQG